MPKVPLKLFVVQNMEHEKPRDLKANATSFKKGRAKTGGRKPGTPNATPKLLKDCILMAAELSGQDGKGKGGLVGFLLRVATEDLGAFAMLLGRVVPLQETEPSPGDGPLARLRCDPLDAGGRY